MAIYYEKALHQEQARRITRDDMQEGKTCVFVLVGTKWERSSDGKMVNKTVCQYPEIVKAGLIIPEMHTAILAHTKGYGLKDIAWTIFLSPDAEYALSWVLDMAIERGFADERAKGIEKIARFYGIPLYTELGEPIREIK